MKISLLLNIRASKRKRKKNYEYNKAIKNPPKGIITSQHGSVGEYLFGLGKVKNVGCGTVAVYNALLLDSKREEYSSVLSCCEQITMLKGLFGCNSYRIGKVLNHFGYKNNEGFSFAHKYKHVDNLKDYGKIFIAAFWNKNSIFGGAHIICCELKPDGKIRTYNASRSEYNSFEEFKEKCLTKKRFIALYAIK